MAQPASSRFARETPLLRDLGQEISWRRDADPLTLMRRLNYALFHAFTYAPSQTRVDSPIDDALKARVGRLSRPRAHHDCPRAPCRHSMPVRQRIPVAKPGGPRSVGGRRDACLGRGISADARMDRIRSHERRARERTACEGGSRSRLRRCSPDARRISGRGRKRAVGAGDGVALRCANQARTRHAHDDLGGAGSWPNQPIRLDAQQQEQQQQQ